MRTVAIHPDRLRNFGDGEGASFCLVTSPSYEGHFRIADGGDYGDRRLITYAGDRPFADLLRDQVPEKAHVLVIMPNHYFKSPAPADLGPRRKLAVMACSSTPTSVAAIEHFVRMAERTDPDRQQSLADDFFACGEAAEAMLFVDRQYGTTAEFEHLHDDLSWHEQIGALDWGQQQLLPAGEISVLPVSVFGQDINSRFRMNGDLAFRGYPVLHSGTPSYLPEDQERIYQALATMRDHAVIARLENGAITEVTPSDPACAPAAHMLEALCTVDSRYRSLLEIGFGINTGLELFAGNSAMNEVYGGTSGAIHYGLGLIPYTQYHLDLICPGTLVVGRQGEPIFGRPAIAGQA